jgi:hypothetical protein
MERPLIRNKLSGDLGQTTGLQKRLSEKNHVGTVAPIVRRAQVVAADGQVTQSPKFSHAELWQQCRELAQNKAKNPIARYRSE